MTLIDLANPTRFLALTARILPWLMGLTAIVLLIGLYQSVTAPDDYQQGATVKIMFIHVPNAWLSMFVWAVMSAASLGTLVWRHPLADVAAKAAAPIGAAFTFLALVTGSLWGRPMWGTYWEWDARLTSVLILFLMYLGLIALWRVGRGSLARSPRRRRADAGRRHQSSDHQVLRRLVEHIAPAGIRIPRRRADARPRLPDSAARDGRRLHAVVPDAASGGDAQRDPAPPRAQPADDASQPAGSMTAMSLGPYATFIVTAYLAATLVVAMLIGWIALDYRSQTQRLRALEESGVVRRSGRGTTEL